MQAGKCLVIGNGGTKIIGQGKEMQEPVLDWVKNSLKLSLESKLILKNQGYFCVPPFVFTTDSRLI